MRMSEATANLFAALAKAQGEITNPVFDAKNPHFGNGYATLAAVRNAVSPSFARHGLTMLTPIVRGESGAGCALFIAHSSGEWIEFDAIYFPIAKDNAHGVAGALTYARRLFTQVAGGCVGDDDDDGNQAAGLPQKPNTAKQAAVDEFDALPEGERKLLQEYATVLIDMHGNGEIPEALRDYVKEKDFTHEHKMALWSLLPSNVRAAIKKSERTTN